MPAASRVFALTLLVFAAISFANAAATPNADTIVLTFKDGHQQSFSLSDVASIEFRNSGKTSGASIGLPDRHRFIGQWTVGDGSGRNFVFTLKDNGEATNNVDSGGHGTWTYVNGEARIAWDNGWHDVIRRVDTKYKKFAFEPGRSFDATPSNTGDAKKNAEPI